MGYDNALTQSRMALDAELKEFLDANSDRRDAAIEAGKQVAGINAQFLKSFSEIQQADMATADKDIAINNLEQSAKQLISATLGTFEGAGAMGEAAMVSLRNTIGATDTISTAISNYFIGTGSNAIDGSSVPATRTYQPGDNGLPTSGEQGQNWTGADGRAYYYDATSGSAVWKPVASSGLNADPTTGAPLSGGSLGETTTNAFGTWKWVDSTVANGWYSGPEELPDQMWIKVDQYGRPLDDPDRYSF
jgi:hypothetical protein